MIFKESDYHETEFSVDFNIFDICSNSNYDRGRLKKDHQMVCGRECLVSSMKKEKGFISCKCKLNSTFITNMEDLSNDIDSPRIYYANLSILPCYNVLHYYNIRYPNFIVFWSLQIIMLILIILQIHYFIMIYPKRNIYDLDCAQPVPSVNSIEMANIANIKNQTGNDLMPKITIKLL